MTIEQWLTDSKADAIRRGLPQLGELLEGLAQSTRALRAAAWNDDAEGQAPRSSGHAEAEPPEK